MEIINLIKVPKFIDFLLESYNNDIHDLEYKLEKLYNKLESYEIGSNIETKESIPEYLVAYYMPKIKPESANRETGGKIGTSSDINMSLIDKNGITVEQASELLYDTYFINYPNIEESDIRQIIIDILLVGKNNYIRNISNSSYSVTKKEIHNLKKEIKNAQEQYELAIQKSNAYV
jgi:hypothetical protein